jgi:hypothetical protein
VVTLASIRVHGQVCAALVSALEVRARHRYRDRRRRPGPASPTLPRTRWPLTARDAGGAPRSGPAPGPARSGQCPRVHPW